VYVYIITQVITADLSFSNVSNCCLYPLIQTLNSSKPPQTLLPLFCPHTVNSSKLSQPLLPTSCPHTSQQIPTISVSHTPCQFTNQQWHDQ